MVSVDKVTEEIIVRGSIVMLMCRYCHHADNLVAGGFGVYCAMKEYLAFDCKGIRIYRTCNSASVVEIFKISSESSKYLSLQDVLKDNQDESMVEMIVIISFESSTLTPEFDCRLIDMTFEKHSSRMCECEDVKGSLQKAKEISGAAELVVEIDNKISFESPDIRLQRIQVYSIAFASFAENTVSNVGSRPDSLSRRSDIHLWVLLF